MITAKILKLGTLKLGEMGMKPKLGRDIIDK